ncbi:MAG: MFS transporter [Pseudomonadota bacterium]
MDRSFLQQNARWLGTGLLLTLASSFGQTYFIAIFADRIMADYGLTDGDWGLIYMCATLSSAAAVVWAGRFADEIRVARLAWLIFAGFAAIAIGMSLNQSPWVLGFLIFGLRFCGQGMISHLGITAMARWFRVHRGRAVAIAGLGYSIGEAALPGLAALAEPYIGWRNVWLVAAFVMLAGFAPFVAWLARDERSPRNPDPATQAPGRDGRHWTRRQVLAHPLFWLLVPGIMANSFIGTVIFFQVAHIAGDMGWTKVGMTALYPAYAVVTVVVSLIAGVLVDRVGPDRLLPVFLLPLGAGVLLIGPFEGIWSWGAALALAGATTGIAHALWGTFWAEIYGTRHIGAVKAVAQAFMVVGSAIGPGITGWAIDQGVQFTGQVLWMTVAVVLISAVHVFVVARLPVRA